MEIDEIIKAMALGIVGYTIGTLIEPTIENILNRIPMLSNLNVTSMAPMIPLLSAALFTLPVTKKMFSQGSSNNKEADNKYDRLEAEINYIKQRLDQIQSYLAPQVQEIPQI